jgi:hypothetical protein
MQQCESSRSRVSGPWRHALKSTDHRCMLQDNAFDCQELYVILHATMNSGPGYKRHAMLVYRIMPNVTA